MIISIAIITILLLLRFYKTAGVVAIIIYLQWYYYTDHIKKMHAMFNNDQLHQLQVINFGL